MAGFLFASCSNDSSKVASTSENSMDSTMKNFDLSAARKTIEDADRQFEQAIQKGDSAALAAMYASDAVALPPNSESVHGSGILSLWGGFIRMGVKDLTLHTTDLKGSADLLAEMGTYEVFGDNHKSLDKGKYVVAWKQENGQWKLYWDIWNSNLPAMPAK